jgi:hypothetical protein
VNVDSAGSDILLSQTDQMHLDTIEHGIVEGVVAKLVEREVRVEFSIQPRQYVAVEGGQATVI